jgi:hypothetical protein
MYRRYLMLAEVSHATSNIFRPLLGLRRMAFLYAGHSAHGLFGGPFRTKKARKYDVVARGKGKDDLSLTCCLCGLVTATRGTSYVPHPLVATSYALLLYLLSDL